MAFKFEKASLSVTYEVDSSFDSEKFIKMELRVAHDGTNPNKSSFQVENFEKAMKSIYNIPILANVIFDDEGNPQFGSHDMTLEDDVTKEGETKLIYKETPIGVVPESCNFRIKEYDGKNYVYVDAYVWKGYSNYAENIIERDQNIKLSMEILVDSASFNGKEKVYNIEDFRFMGITFLNNKLGTGMAKAMGTVGSFSENESYKEKFIQIMSDLKTVLETYNLNESEGKGDTDTLENTENIVVMEETTQTEEAKVESVESTATENTVPEETKYVKSFELSHEDIRYALYVLLDPIASEDNEWYFIDHVFESNFEYTNWEGTKIFRQGYAKNGDNIEFAGDRIELFQERMTKEEKDALDKIRNNYVEIKSDFDTYKEKFKTDETKVAELRNFKQDRLKNDRDVAEKAIFEKFDEKLKENKEYLALKEKASDYTIEALEKECFYIAGKSTVTFSEIKPKAQVSVSVDRTESKENKYDDLYEKYSSKRKNN